MKKKQYKIWLNCFPFPVEYTVIAENLKQAYSIAILKAKKDNLKPIGKFTQ